MANKKISKVTKALKFFFEKDDKFNWVVFNSIILIFSGIWAVTTLFNDNQNQSKDRINEKNV